MKKLLLLFLFIGQFVHATTYKVGSTRIYNSPNALYLADILQDGDRIEIDAETYTGQAALAVWGKHHLIFIGVGGRPHLEADGQNISGKGIWVLAGNYITVENIEFSGATVPDKNGAGIRLDGNGMNVSNCYFHHNEDGILTSNTYAGNIVIEFSEFAYNGYGDGQSHNVYIGHIGTLRFVYNYSHHAYKGHNFKSRAAENYILYNRIMDENTGESSRLIDLPNGGESLIMGNLLMQGPNAENNNLIGYGLEGLTNPTSNLLVINNTLVNKRSTCLFIDIEDGTFIYVVVNNIFAGSGTITSVSPTSMNHNLFETNSDDILFVDESNYDYRIKQGSPAIDAGEELSNYQTPNHQYVHPTNEEPRPTDGTIDLGAYEFNATQSLDNNMFDNLSIYPNPTSDFVKLHFNKPGEYHLTLIDQNGKMVLKAILSNEENKIDLAGLPNGIYIIQIENDNNGFTFEKIIKE